jgi:hypothetical protein
MSTYLHFKGTVFSREPSIGNSHQEATVDSWFPKPAPSTATKHSEIDAPTEVELFHNIVNASIALPFGIHVKLGVNLGFKGVVEVWEG